MLSRQLYIGGKLLPGQSSHDVINPATEEAVGTVAVAGLEEVDIALKAAQEAFPVWSKTSISERVDWMQVLRDEVIANEQQLRECVHLEMGKSWSGTQDDYDLLINSLEYYAKEIARLSPESLADKEGTHNHSLVYEPVGVAAAFLAWNFPLLNLAYKLGPAMAAGCPIILKPSIKTPLSAYAVGEICHQIGLPAGVVNILSGVDRNLGDAISASKIPSMLTLIGSTQTGIHVMKTGATSIKRYSMELGGNAPVLVCADADLDLAADVICGLKYSNSGQICVSPNRVFVAEEVASAFQQKVVERAKAVKVGFDKDADFDMGPVVDGSNWRRIDGLVQEAIEKGAELLTGGGRPEGLEKGHFYAPTVLSGVNSSMTIYREEIFGPVVSLMTFDDEEAVLEAANDTEAGLTAYVFSKDLEKAERFAEQLRFGEIQINGVKYSIELPHCGMKQSGIGVDCSHLALDDYLTPKRISRAI